MRSLLASDGEDLPRELIAEYDCSELHSCLGGMLLSRGGIHEAGYVQVCEECNSSLLKEIVPKFATKNGFAIETLPIRFLDVTLPERLITQPVSVVSVTRVMRGGAHRSIRSHCLAFDAAPGPAATLLPIPVVGVSTYRVVLAGPFTTEQQARVRQMHRVCREVVDDLLRFYKLHNPLYASISVSSSTLTADVVADNIIFEAAGAEVDDIDIEQDRVGGVSELDASTAESDVVEHRVVFVADDREVSTQGQHVAAGLATDTAPEPHFLVRHSTQFAQKDNVLFARMFPHLFPYGRGHPGEERHVPVSFEACVRHYSMLSSRRFAKDELFVLASFDYLSVQKMYTQVGLKCRRNPELFERYIDITEEALLRALKEKELQLQGRATSARGHDSGASAFLRPIELSGSSMWGSDGERAQCRRRAFAYQARFGQPAFFVILTPNVTDSFVMAQYCGVTSVDTLFDAALSALPGRSALRSAAMRNDIASAWLFVRNIDACIEHVLGVSPKHMTAKPFDGLFGPVQAYFGMVETQGGGTLHAHFLVWLVDSPPNSDAFDRAVAAHGDRYYRDVEAFADSVVSTSMPLSVADSSCVICRHSYADLQQLPIPPEAYEDPNKHRGRPRGEPLLVRCAGCGIDLSSQYVVRRLLLDNRPILWPVDDERFTPCAVAFAVSMLVFMLNMHWWSHAGSCLKKSRASIPGRCRYGFPRDRAAQTSCSNDSVTLARRAPFEFVNGFNRGMMLTFKSNNDIQVMIGGLNVLLRIYYATKYVTKMQEQVNSITAVALAAFQRRQMRESLDEDTTAADPASTGRERVASLLYAITNRSEIAGPLAALYLLRGSCAFMSTACATLPLQAVLDALVDQSAHSCDLVELREHGESEVTFRAASFLDDYLFRPPMPDPLSLYEYVAKHFRRKRTEASAENVFFLSEHPPFESHCVGTHIDDVVPVVVGVRMPFVDSESPLDYIVKRSHCALAIFKPFRVTADLVAGDPADDDAWVEAFSQWEPTRSSFTREMMANMDDYHRAKRQAEECCCEPGDGDEMNPSSTSDADEITGARDDVDSALNHAAACEAESTNAAGADTIFSTIVAATRATATMTPTGHLLGLVARSTAGTAANLRSEGSAPHFSIDELQRFVKDTLNDEAEPHRSEQYRNERSTEVIELLARALEDGAEWGPPSQPATSPPPLRAYSSIGEVTQKFTLNQRQHAAFALIATSLLRRFLHQELGSVDANGGDGNGTSSSTAEARFRDEQLLMYLGGAGGTGKSRVIDAVHAFSASWHRDDAVEKTALTGKAATLIGGRTLASFMMRLQHAILDKHFAPLDLLIIDEVSMMSKSEWLKLDKTLRLYKQLPTVPFGGVHMVLVGDFLQMPPVKADPIYVDPADKAKPTTVDVEGFELWRQINTVIVLDESVRFRSDPEWGAGCGLARLGQWTPEFIDLVNSRVLQPHSQQQQVALRDEIGADAVFVTPENATRLAINNIFVAETASMLPGSMFPVRVIANFKGALNVLGQSDLRYVMGLPDNRFGRMAPYLDLIEGMPIQVTQNVATAKGIANGTLGTLESVHFPDGTSFRLVRDGATNTVVQLPNRAPDYAMLRVPRPRASAIRPEVDPDLFPVFFRHRGIPEDVHHAAEGPGR